MTRLYAYLIAIAGCTAAIGYTAWRIDQNGYERAKNECRVEHADAADKAQAEINRRDERSAEARTSMLDYLASIPKIEAKSHDASERIRVVYRTQPVPAAGACRIDRPASVQAELSAARDRIAAAVGAL